MEGGFFIGDSVDWSSLVNWAVCPFYKSPGYSYSLRETRPLRGIVIEFKARRNCTPNPSARDPAVPVVARVGALLEITHLDPAQIVGGNLVAPGVHIDAENPRAVQAEDLLLHRTGQRCVAMPLDQGVGNLETAERFDLPLRRAIPDRIGSPKHVIRAERVDQLTQQMRARRGIGRDEHHEGGAH